ncbi:hypothetical protein [uncultured Aquimarina sp.]|uniref:hypothetical protein n=1 Tax=uncultured Aquimarina sp. TaxID=575652 RepID=UPI0026336625|nr:hypothetical protein [uncultured Aquimarina sp.]
MSSKNNSFKKILEDNGYTFPKTENQVNEFESSLKGKFHQPENWDNIDDILNKKSGLKLLFNNSSASNKETENYLSMAAREGKEISDEVKKKMKEDRDKTNGK